jgi:methanethiol oxidase
MATWKPDPTFYPSPRMAMKAPAETVAYVASFDPKRQVPDRIAVVDVDPKSATYSKIINNVAMPGTSCIILAGMPVRRACARMRRTRTWNAGI